MTNSTNSSNVSFHVISRFLNIPNIIIENHGSFDQADALVKDFCLFLSPWEAMLNFEEGSVVSLFEVMSEVDISTMEREVSIVEKFLSGGSGDCVSQDFLEAMEPHFTEGARERLRENQDRLSELWFERFRRALDQERREAEEAAFFFARRAEG
jgi:hypothetical protein